MFFDFTIGKPGCSGAGNKRLKTYPFGFPGFSIAVPAFKGDAVLPAMGSFIDDFGFMIVINGLPSVLYVLGRIVLINTAGTVFAGRVAQVKGLILGKDMGINTGKE